MGGENGIRIVSYLKGGANGLNVVSDKNVLGKRIIGLFNIKTFIGGLCLLSNVLGNIVVTKTRIYQ